MSKGNKLTFWILVSMVLGILVGYIYNQYGTGSKITYTPTRDYVGYDTLNVNFAGNPIQQRIFIVKDSTEFKSVRDSIGSAAWMAVSNTSTNFNLEGDG